MTLWYLILLMLILKFVEGSADYKYIYLFYNRDPIETEIEGLEDPVGHPKFQYSGTKPHIGKSGIYFSDISDFM
jgi:hypothetical protein